MKINKCITIILAIGLLSACNIAPTRLRPTPTAATSIDRIQVTIPGLTAADQQQESLSAAPTPSPWSGANTATPVPPDEQIATKLRSSLSRLAEEGLLPDDQGSMEALPDFEASWARLNYYDWMATGEYARDFAIRADVAWQLGGIPANWWNSGCGFAFRMNARGDHYFAYLGLDGFVNVFKNIDGSIQPLDRTLFDQVDREQGKAEMLIVAYDDNQLVMVDGEVVSQVEDSTLPAGALSYAIASGTNDGFGIRCTMTNIVLWRPSSAAGE